jgi:hypothetical protein
MPAMAKAFERFTEYITYLAEGKLDGYINSTRPEDLVTDLKKIKLPSRPMLLLHDLGTDQGKERIQGLFADDTMFGSFFNHFHGRWLIQILPCSHLFAVSGSGKTRLSLEGLCHNWGFYISCRGGSEDLAAGSYDFQKATKMMEQMSQWDDSIGTDKADNTKNVKVAYRAFAMLICARVFVLRQFMNKLPNGTDLMAARRRWVLVQAMPPFFVYPNDIFTVVLGSLRSANTEVMLSLADSMLSEMRQKGNLPDDRLFVVVDEAQVAAVHLKESFRSVTTGIDERPVLHAFHRFLWDTNLFQGVILAGTGLSMKMVKTSVSSQSAQRLKKRLDPIVFVEVGRFMKGGTDHESYIRKYLSLSPSSASDRRLIERILYWFTGRWAQISML